MEAIIHFIWKLASVLFGSQYPEYLDNDVQFIRKSFSKQFGYQSPMYVDVSFRQLWEPVSDLI